LCLVNVLVVLNDTNSLQDVLLAVYHHVALLKRLQPRAGRREQNAANQT
jgi:hypothetical protein